MCDTVIVNGNQMDDFVIVIHSSKFKNESKLKEVNLFS